MDVAEEDDHDQLPALNLKLRNQRLMTASWQPLNSSKIGFNTCQVASIKFKFNSHRLTAIKQLAENPRTQGLVLGELGRGLREVRALMRIEGTSLA